MVELQERLVAASGGDTAHAAGVHRMLRTAPGTRREGGGRVAPQPAARPLHVLQGGRRRGSWRLDLLVWAVLVLGSAAWRGSAIRGAFLLLDCLLP
jgi:hypothetical protein